MKKIAVLAVFILCYGYGTPILAETPDTEAARIAAKNDAERDANSDINQLFWSIGGSSLVALSAVGGAFLGCSLGAALDNPRKSLAPTDPEGMPLPAIISTGVVYGCLGGWGFGFAGSVYGIYKLGGTVPSERLIGKSPEYIRHYNDLVVSFSWSMID